jgi:hypothetical protein
LNHGRGNRFSCLQNSQDHLWFPSSLLFNGCKFFFFEWESDQGVKLTTLLCLVPRLRISGAISVLPLYALMGCTLTPLPMPLRARRHIGDTGGDFPITSWNTKLEGRTQQCQRKGGEAGTNYWGPAFRKGVLEPTVFIWFCIYWHINTIQYNTIQFLAGSPLLRGPNKIFLRCPT